MTTQTCLREAETVQAGAQVTIKRYGYSYCSLLFGSAFMFNGAFTLLWRSCQFSVKFWEEQRI